MFVSSDMITLNTLPKFNRMFLGIDAGTQWEDRWHLRRYSIVSRVTFPEKEKKLWVNDSEDLELPSQRCQNPQ
jgi:hypothetical protein